MLTKNAQGSREEAFWQNCIEASAERQRQRRRD
jgi:hypothetical protein